MSRYLSRSCLMRKSRDFLFNAVYDCSQSYSLLLKSSIFVRSSNLLNKLSSFPELPAHLVKVRRHNKFVVDILNQIKIFRSFIFKEYLEYPFVFPYFIYPDVESEFIIIVIFIPSFRRSR
jgi:hypothetical protein